MYKGAHILPYKGDLPTLGKNIFLAPGAVVTGRVTLGNNVNIWCNAVLRGDVHFIEIGDNTNIQDGCVCHVTHDTHPLIVGANVTVGHGAILHGCTVEDTALIGMGTIVLDGAVVGKGALVAAGAVVTPRTEIPAGEVWAGNPAQKMRDVKPAEAAWLLQSANYYVDVAGQYNQEIKENANEEMKHGN